MNLALLVLLALVWGVVLLPSAIRNHRRSLHHSMGGFQRSMQVLSGGAAAPARRDVRRVLVPGDAARIVAPPRGAERARERRRKALVRLLVAATMTTAAALLLGGAVTWLLAVVADTALALYATALRRLAVQAARRRELVRLGDRRPQQAPGQWQERRVVGV